MYERKSYQRLGQPVLVWLGLEFREIAVAIGGGAAVAVLFGFILGFGLVGILMGFATGAGLVVLFRSLRSGGPGYVLAAIYRAGLLELLPAGIRPRHLLPLGRLGHRGRVYLSPRVETVTIHGELDARRYFGK